MKNLNTMRNDIELKLDKEFQAKLKKYRDFMKLISDCIAAIVPVSMFDDLTSYIVDRKEEYIKLRYHDDGIHYNYIDVGVDMNSRELRIISFSAHDAYYDPKVSFTSDDEKIVEFFNHEFNEFKKWLTYDGTVSTKKLVKAINDGIYSAYESEFRKLSINEYNFADSAYALNLGEFEEEITVKIKKLSDESGLDL